MKQANGIVRLSKEHDVPIRGVTPWETILLTAEHHRNVGGAVVEVDKTTITEIQIDVPADGKTPATKRTRTNDEELDRLRSKYGNAKVKAVLNEVRDVPDDYEKATERGTRIVLPSGKLSETKIL